MIRRIWLKEMKEVLRDRKTMGFVVLFPTMMLPALILCVGLIGYQLLLTKQAERIDYGLIGPAVWVEEVERALASVPNLNRIDGVSRQRASGLINEGRLDFVLQMLPGFDPLTNPKSQWQMLYNQTDDHGQFVRVRQALSALQQRWMSGYLLNQGVGEDVIRAVEQPMILARVETAAERQSVGDKVGGILPFLLLFLCMMGAMLPALDIGAGEKERGTLETLLMVPQPRTTLVVGKFLVIATTSMMLALLTLISAIFWLLAIGYLLDLNLFIRLAKLFNPMDIGLLLLLLLPIAGVFAALLLSISIFAKSYKEGQNYMGALQFVAIIPAMVATLPGIELTRQNAWYPIFNVLLATKELLKGTFAYYDLAAVFASNLILASLLLWCCVQWFRRESVLFR
ncbi:ABC transporter permease subunit [Ferrimonas sp. SCSIO 43195]|uniref:ABC transporter permease subunit n=1 Tax=Ferrimonas sp. SCSIO 43195 TaxID=2822844 RepID=UPI002074CD41|nr:ABC transporter permease subunit [Ferrimonas sp. SCSIO 43195]USD36142.1 ABC transporter permease [Ferrimonas sp. SCSIO 43195]